MHDMPMRTKNWCINTRVELNYFIINLDMTWHKKLTSLKLLPSALASSYIANKGTNIMDETASNQPTMLAQTGYT